MRALCLFYLLITLSLGQQERVLEWRSYAAPLEGFYKLPSRLDGVIERFERFNPGNAEGIEGQSVKSVFVGDGDEVKELTGWGRRMLFFEGREDRLIWNDRTKRLLVWSDERGHQEVALHFAEFLEVHYRVRVEVMLAGKLQGKLTGNLEGELVGENDGLSGVMEGYGSDDAFWGGSFSLQSQLPGAGFEVECFCLGAIGKVVVMNLGRLGGKEEVSLKILVEGLLPDGTSLQKWAVKEDGTSPWWSEVLGREFGPWQGFEKDERKRIRRRFEVPGLAREWFEEELFSKAANPFGGKVSPRAFLEHNAVNFRDDDWAIYEKSSGVLEMAIAPDEFFLAEGAFGHGDPAFFGLIEVELTQVGSEDETLQKIAVLMSEGQGKVRLGEGLELVVEASFGWGYSSVDCKVGVTGKEAFETRLSVESGTRLVVQESFDGMERRKWVMTVRVRGREDFR